MKFIRHSGSTIQYIMRQQVELLQPTKNTITYSHYNTHS